MTAQTVVGTANVLRSLSTSDARDALSGVLALEPDLVALQEWEVPRLGLLRETGSVRFLPGSSVRLQRRGGIRRPHYVWHQPLLRGCPVGARADRYDVLSSQLRLLSGVGRADRPDRPMQLEPPRLVTVATYFDRLTGRRVSLLNYHLAPGVQSRGAYREDRPKLSARHRNEVAKLQRLVDERLALGHEVYAVGDSNFDGLRLSGLTSVWEGRADHSGTHGRSRKIDDIHGPGAATSVALLASASDHKAVVATRSW